MKREIVSIAFVLMLFVSMLFSSLPLVSAAYTVEYPYMPPDLVGDCNTDGYVNSKDAVILGVAFGSKPGDSIWDPRADLNREGYVNAKDSVILGNNFRSVEGPPIAYSTTFEFTVPEDGDKEVWYYILTRVYVPSELSGQNFYFVATADDSVQNIKLDGVSKAGSEGSVNIDLGSLNSGYHLLEFEFVETTAAGVLNFHVATTAEEYAWLSRFRVYVPNYSDDEMRYTVETRTYFPGDTFFIGISAIKHLIVDDYIDDVYIDAGLLWQDWMWDMGDYGAIYAWGDGFLYPLGWQSGWHTITFIFGEIWGPGLLDFQYISRTNQPAKIGNPRFWARISEPHSPYPSGDIRYLKIYDVKTWGGSKWASTTGSSMRMIAVGLKILANVTDTDTFYPIPQEAEVTLILDMPGYEWPLYSPQDIGLHINVTYTYFDEEIFVYSFPIWFEGINIELKTATQGLMFYIPYPSIIFANDSEKSFITPEWSILYDISKGLIVPIFTGIVGFPFGTLIGAFQYWRITKMEYESQQQLNSTWEETGSPIYRQYHMNIFKTTRNQVPLSEPVKSISNGFFLRILPYAAGRCGAVNFTLQGRLWLPFFYSGEPPPGSPNWYGEWLPVDIEILIVIPVFIKD